jgi:hypothetical protein
MESGALAEMTGAEAKVLIVYAVYGDYYTGEAYPSMETIAGDAGISNLHRARQAIQASVKRGVLEETRKSSGRNTVEALWPEAVAEETPS